MSLEDENGRLVITVRDEGRGVDLAAVAAADSPSDNWMSSKFGLFSIRERMRALSGSFEIESSPGKGTTATLTLPLRNARAARTEDSQLKTEPTLRESKRVFGTPTSGLHRDVKIRILLVDDHVMVRQALRTVLESHSDIEVVGEACDGREAVDLAERLTPEVIIMDVNMPNMNGIEATVGIKSRHPGMKIVGLSVNADGETKGAMLHAGAETLLTQRSRPESAIPGDSTGALQVAVVDHISYGVLTATDAPIPICGRRALRMTTSADSSVCKKHAPPELPRVAVTAAMTADLATCANRNTILRLIGFITLKNCRSLKYHWATLGPSIRSHEHTSSEVAPLRGGLLRRSSGAVAVRHPSLHDYLRGQRRRYGNTRWHLHSLIFRPTDWRKVCNRLCAVRQHCRYGHRGVSAMASLRSSSGRAHSSSVIVCVPISSGGFTEVVEQSRGFVPRWKSFAWSLALALGPYSIGRFVRSLTAVVGVAVNRRARGAAAH